MSRVTSQLPAAGSAGGPYDSVRDFLNDLEARGRVERIREMDQDAFEMTAFAYRLLDRLGYEKAPAFVVERVKTGGQWREGPVLGNQFGSWVDEALVFGVENVSQDQEEMYWAVMDKLFGRLDSGGRWQRIPPVEISNAADAPCKQVTLTGDEIDIEQFAWLQNNPADAGRYINMGAVFVDDPEFGSNVGTYRCQVQGPRQIGVNMGPGQHAWRILNSMRKRGDKFARCAVAVGVDPITFVTSSTKMADFGVNELEVAGGLRGKPVEVVRCETCDIRVPAHAEMIIEGEIPLDKTAPEGPYGELFGFLGPQVPENFFMELKLVTHRDKPWIQNSFTGITLDMPKGPQTAAEFNRYKQLIPNLTGFYTPKGTIGVVFVRINKRFPGEGMAAGQQVSANPGQNKIVIVVDHDVNIFDPVRVLHAIGARWQPGSATLVVPQTQMLVPDPSKPHTFLSSKIVIDATRQLPAEGGPKKFAPVSRELLRDSCPDLFAQTDAKWGDIFAKWGG